MIIDQAIVSKNVHHGERKESKGKQCWNYSCQHTKNCLRQYYQTVQRLFDSIAKCFIPEGWLLVENLFRTLLHPHAGPLSHHTAESETLPTTKWVSQWAHWKNSGHTCLSLSWDSTAVRNKVVRSAWPRSVTAPVKLWLSTSAARRKSILIHVGLFREWKMTTPSHGV